jgi:radical SAM enzyme (TIGR01210 family)
VIRGFPTGADQRDRFVLDRRADRPRLDPWRHQGLVVEDERTADGQTARVATVFLTGRECPWRCTMCDLWTHTIDDDTPRGAIPAQIASAREELHSSAPEVTALKLYNAGSFFDPRAVPDSDYDAIASALAGLERVIVESHPALIGRRVDAFADSLRRRDCQPANRFGPDLEVAMGLETAHPAALDALNKRFTVDQFTAAAAALRDRGVAVRVFLLVSPPFIAAEDQEAWLIRSVDVAFTAGASVVSLVPTRGGNGAMETLAELGAFRQPTLAGIERSLAIGLAAAGGRGRVFADLWDLARFASCSLCVEPRKARLHSMNLEQRIGAPPAPCAACGAFSS